MAARTATDHPDDTPGRDVTIRLATPADADLLERLAALDSRAPLAGRCLLAEVDGRPWAALALATGDVAADPFRPTADLVTLLEARARHLHAPGSAARRPMIAWMDALRPARGRLHSG